VADRPIPDLGEPKAPTPTASASRTPGWREAMLLGAIVVGVVFSIQVLTSLLPAPLQDLVFRTPLTIAVLLIGTLGLMAWLARRPAV